MMNNALVVLTIIMIFLMIIIANKDAIRNLFGLILNVFSVFILITLINFGFNPLAVLTVIVPIIVAVTIFMSADENQVTFIAFKTSMIVIILLFPIAIIVQVMGHFQGFAAENVDELENLSLAVEINFSDVAIVVLVVSVIGAISESSIALAASLTEVIDQDDLMTVEQLKSQRKLISEQILGTATNTLFFGMLGSSAGLILWFTRLNYRIADILNSKLLVADTVTMLLGMIGILVAIIISGYFVEKNFISQSSNNEHTKSIQDNHHVT